MENVVKLELILKLNVPNVEKRKAVFHFPVACWGELRFVHYELC
jgi:hypothetical protein